MKDKNISQIKETLEYLLEMVKKLDERDTKIAEEQIEPLRKHLEGFQDDIENLIESYGITKKALEKTIMNQERMSEDYDEFKSCLSECPVVKKREYEPIMDELSKKWDKYMEDERYGEGIRYMLDRVDQFEHFSQYWNLLGILYASKKDTRRAIRAYNRAKELEPTRFEPYCSLMKIYAREGNSDAAAAEMELAYQRIPLDQCHDYYGAVGKIFAEVGSKERVKNLSLELKAERDECRSCFLAYLYRQVGEPELAIDEIQETDNHSCPVLDVLKLDLQSKINGIDSIISNLNPSMIDIPASIMARNLLISFFKSFEDENTGALETLLDESISHTPAREQSEYGLHMEILIFSLLKKDCHNTDLLLKAIDRTRELRDSPQLRILGIIVLDDAEMIDDARNLALNSMEEFPDYADLLMISSSILHKSGNNDDRDDAIRKFLALENIGTNCFFLEKMLSLGFELESELGLKAVRRISKICVSKCSHKKEKIESDISALEKLVKAEVAS